MAENIITKPYFDTIVIRRPTGLLNAGGGSIRIGVREIQCWVNGVKFMIDNGLTSYFANWLNKEVDIGFTVVSIQACNNIIEINEGSQGGALSPIGIVNNALIIKTFH
jgi:hypothetical protein